MRVVHEGKNVDINEPGTTAGAFTALHYAAEFSMCHLAAKLIDAGSDLEARTEDMLVPSGGAVRASAGRSLAPRLRAVPGAVLASGNAGTAQETSRSASTRRDLGCSRHSCSN